MARIIRTEKRKRGFFGSVFKWTFILFNVLMLAWLVSYWASVGNMVSSADSNAARAGATIGTAIGTSMVLGIWTCGAMVLGMLTMLTRGAKVVIEERVEQ